MRKLTLLVAIGCLLAIYSCQKETIAPVPESTNITTETTRIIFALYAWM